MEIKIRNIDASIVKKLDMLAKEKKISRQEFLRKELEILAYKKEIYYLEEKYKKLINNLMESLISYEKLLGLFIYEFIIESADAFDYDLDTFIKTLKNTSENLSESKTKLKYNISDKSNILVRNVPLDVYETIKEIAKRKNISQNEFLNMYLRQLTYSDSLQLIDSKYNYMIEKTLGLLDYTNNIFAIFIEENIIY